MYFVSENGNTSGESEMPTSRISGNVYLNKK